MVSDVPSDPGHGRHVIIAAPGQYVNVMLSADVLGGHLDENGGRGSDAGMEDIYFIGYLSAW